MARDDVETIEIRLLLDAIYSQYGYDLRDYSPASMRRRVRAVLAKTGFAHLGELQHRILVDPIFFAAVIEDFTVRVSEMFRDPSFYKTFRGRVVPILRTYPVLRVWHSGCATGEEAYASAILFSEEGLYDRTQIYATDLSANAIDQAKSGIYSAEHLSTFSENYLKSGGQAAFTDYCTTAYGGFAMSAAIRRNVHFFQHDLVSDHVFGEMHVIFCRNVLIYFANELRDRVLHKFAQSICPGGFLCLGSSESLARSAGGETFADFAPSERIYRHGG
jgi:chemotaxis protein methyltransferase CheR